MVQVLVLINAEKVSVLDVVGKLEKMPEVVSAFPTFGRFDVVAFCNVNDRDGIRALVKKIAGLEGVLKTETLVEL
ncbi:MAG: Lrp/AsnC ligand binding domain-containing protein [Candidatus Methanomethylicaceae archaeon]